MADEGTGPRLLAVPVVADMLGMSERATWALLSSKQLASVKIGRRRLIDKQDVEGFIQQHKETVNGRA